MHPDIHQGAQLTWQYFSIYRTRNEATRANRDEKLKENRIVWLTRSVSCSGVCPSVWPVWSSDPGQGTPWSQSSYEVLTVWGYWELDGGRPALKTKGCSCCILMSSSVGVFTTDIHIWLTFKAIKTNKTERLKDWNSTEGWNSTEEQAPREDNCLPAKAAAAAEERTLSQTQGQSHDRASQDRQCLALPFITVTLYLDKG